VIREPADLGIGLMSPMLWLGAFGRRIEVPSFRTFDTAFHRAFSQNSHTFVNRCHEFLIKCY
jgi:hypothetical protein